MAFAAVGVDASEICTSGVAAVSALLVVLELPLLELPGAEAGVSAGVSRFTGCSNQLALLLDFELQH